MSDNEKPETKSARSNQQRIFPVKQWRRRKKNYNKLQFQYLGCKHFSWKNESENSIRCFFPSNESRINMQE